MCARTGVALDLTITMAEAPVLAGAHQPQVGVSSRGVVVIDGQENTAQAGWRHVRGVTGQLRADQVLRIVVSGSAGNDNIDLSAVGAGFSRMTGATVGGGEGRDIINGTAFDDTIHGGGGVDRIFGRDGNDTLFGDDGDDELWGDGNASYYDTRGGNDCLDGGVGDDDLHGGGGNDAMVGGPGADLFFESPYGGSDTIDIDATVYRPKTAWNAIEIVTPKPPPRW